jgi:hypothetical protein
MSQAWRDDGGRAMTAPERNRRYRANRQAKKAAGDPVAPLKSREARRRNHKAYAATPAGKAAMARRRRRLVDGRAFMAVDGEGAGTDAEGRQLYLLLRAGDRELYTGKHLTTAECLEFLCECSPEPIMVGFSFGYDVTMILRDLPPERRARLLADKPAEQGHSRYTWWKDFGIEYLPKNYIRVCRTRLVPTMGLDGRETMTRRRIEGTSRTIYETFGFFQKSFLKTILAFEVGTLAQRERIRRNKERRGQIPRITAEERRYCALECEFLADLMTIFRKTCIDANIRPRTWNGAGKLAGALHTMHETMTTARMDEVVPAAVQALANGAYYGGRFEVTRTGAIQGPVYEYDIRSAYPAAMGELPCLEHGRWVPASVEWLRKAPDDALFVAPVRFNHDPSPSGERRNLCGLPLRKRDGRLCWPVEGNGVYWAPEIRAAAKLGCRVVYKPGGWRYERQCECRMFPWVDALYRYRQSIGASLVGYPIKLAINALYGRLAQRIGNPKWANLVWAGLITALTRAKLMDAAASDPTAVLMLATDALFSRRPLAVPTGDGLGQWEVAEHKRLFLVQPGIYWGAKQPKTRGVSPGFFEEKTGIFEAAWAEYATRDRAVYDLAGRVEPPIVTLPLTLFIGLRLAQARGKPETAGQWVAQDRHFRFDWSAKRGRHTWETDDCVWTYPLAGGSGVVSEPHKSNPELVSIMDGDKAELDDQPDLIDLTPPWSE